MIGLIATPDELPVAEEFFQLFKTPWEPFVPDHSYEVILSTDELPADGNAKLFLLFSSDPLPADAEAGFTFRRRLRDRIVRLKNQTLPLYRDIATTPAGDETFGSVEQDSEALACQFTQNDRPVVRLGYDLFCEVAFLLSSGQPPERAGFPTLDLHIEVLRRLMLEHGLAVLEIPPVPAGARFISCLTHDIDFISLRHHRWDRAACGFFYRATIGTVLDLASGRGSLDKLAKNTAAVLKWPLVQLGLMDDFWLPFAKYLEAEQGRPSTFYLIPFKNRGGRAPLGRNSSRRGVRYDVTDVEEWIPKLQQRGCEVAVHGIDAWHGRGAGREELERLASRTGERNPGVRMHWLYFANNSPKELEAAGFSYDSTCGYNDAVGYRAGTTQVFRPLGTSRLLELPLHMQDTAMFFPGRMHLAEAEAWKLFAALLEHSRQEGGVLTVLWHDRSLAPERLWGDFYREVLQALSAGQTWFATARDVIAWFKARRQIDFRSFSHDGDQVRVSLGNVPPAGDHDLVLRLTVAGERPGEVNRVDLPLQGRSEVRLTRPCTVARAEVQAQTA